MTKQLIDSILVYITTRLVPFITQGNKMIASVFWYLNAIKLYFFMVDSLIDTN